MIIKDEPKSIELPKTARLLTWKLSDLFFVVRPAENAAATVLLLSRLNELLNFGRLFIKAWNDFDSGHTVRSVRSVVAHQVESLALAEPRHAEIERKHKEKELEMDMIPCLKCFSTLLECEENRRGSHKTAEDR